MTYTADKPVHILLVDDSRDEVELASMALARLARPLEITTAMNGHEAVEAILNVKSTIDVVLLDLNLPLLSGLDVLRLVRPTYPPGSLPIIMLTTSRDPKDRKRAVALECDEFHVKPVSFQESIELYKAVLGRWFPAEAEQTGQSQ